MTADLNVGTVVGNSPRRGLSQLGCAVYQSGWSNPATRTTDERLPYKIAEGPALKRPT